MGQSSVNLIPAGQPALRLSMSRRSLLIALGAWAVAQGVAGCGSRGSAALNIEYLDSSMPTSLLQEFQRSVVAERVKFVPVENLAELYDHLVVAQQPARPQTSPLGPLRRLLGGDAPDAQPSNQRSAQFPTRAADWLTLGDYWLAAAIQYGLIDPLDQEMLPGWANLPSLWQRLVRRDEQGHLAAAGKIWAAPYRWGSLAIAYQIEAFEALGWAPTDWGDLWRPEIAGKMSLLDSPRAVIGLTLKHLGETLNSLNPQSVSELPQALGALQAQVKTYSSTAYLQPLLLGDTWLAVGWSSDILPLLRRDPRYGAVVPSSGTALFADLWVRPALSRATSASSGSAQSDLGGSGADENTKTLLSQWIEFCWQPDTAQRLSIQSYGASPMVVTGDRANLAETLRDEPVLLPDAEVLEKSEFIAPLPDEAIAHYRELWIKMRRGELG